MTLRYLFQNTSFFIDCGSGKCFITYVAATNQILCYLVFVLLFSSFVDIIDCINAQRPLIGVLLTHISKICAIGEDSSILNSTIEISCLSVYIRQGPI